MKIIEREDKMYERVHVYEKEKKIAYETLSILNKEIDKARLVLDSLTKECDDNKFENYRFREQNRMCCKTDPSRTELIELGFA